LDFLSNKVHILTRIWDQLLFGSQDQILTCATVQQDLSGSRYISLSLILSLFYLDITWSVECMMYHDFSSGWFPMIYSLTFISRSDSNTRGDKSNRNSIDEFELLSFFTSSHLAGSQIVHYFYRVYIFILYSCMSLRFTWIPLARLYRNQLYCAFFLALSWVWEGLRLMCDTYLLSGTSINEG